MTEIIPAALILKKHPISQERRSGCNIVKVLSEENKALQPHYRPRTIRLPGDHKTRYYRIMVHLTMPTLLIPYSNCAKLFLTGGHHFIVTYITE